jgi:hypothetical protein
VPGDIVFVTLLLLMSHLFPDYCGDDADVDNENILKSSAH